MGPVLVTSVPKFVAWREQRDVLQHVAAFSSVEPVSIAIGGAPEPRPTVYVSADYFPVFGIQATVGRVLTSAEDVPGGRKGAVISHRVWRRHFTAAPLADRTLVVEKDATWVGTPRRKTISGPRTTPGICCTMSFSDVSDNEAVLRIIDCFGGQTWCGFADLP